MKRFLVTTAAMLLGAAVLVFLFRAPLKDMAIDKLTANMFVPEDTDSFDPGPALGSHFPGLRAVYQGLSLIHI